MLMYKQDKRIYLRKQWESFISSGNLSADIKNNIMESWLRCKEYKVDPYSGACNRVLSKNELKKKLIQNEFYVNAVKVYSDKLYECIRGSGYIIFYTDVEGNILYTLGDKNVMEDFTRNLNFNIGVVWNEETVGTTAVSLVLTEGGPVPFISEEKYCLLLKQRACSGVPIKDNSGNAVGVLGVATNAVTFREDVFGMLLIAQAAIENYIKVYQITEEKNLLKSYYSTILNSITEGIISTDHNGKVIEINKSAEDMLLINRTKSIGKNIDEIINLDPSYMERIQRLKDDNQLIFKESVRGKCVFVDKCLPILDNSNQVNALVNILNRSSKSDSNVKEQQNIARYTFDDIVGKSRQIIEVKKIAKMAAPSNANILITGSTGVGKELFAHAIHNESNYKKGPFVAVNCGAIPKDLIESEFFGYEEGSFTGAKSGGKQGKFELASGGTIFLDEIGEMPLDMQVRLLRVIQEKQITRIGGRKVIPIDARIIAATNKDLDEQVRLGYFRADLYWRLNVVMIKVPDLGERKSDIRVLFNHFLQKQSKKYVIQNDALEVLINYNWPGNIRELNNVLERAVILTNGNIITKGSLPEYILNPAIQNVNMEKATLDEAEKQVIEKCLIKNKYNISKVAKALGMSRNTLYSRIDKYKITIK